jgi:hypothetical protein
MITLEKAQELLGRKDIPNDPEHLELLEMTVENNGEAWVKEHAELLLAQWEYISTW